VPRIPLPSRIALPRRAGQLRWPGIRTSVEAPLTARAADG
jgi:hypothetical protein